MRGVRAHWKVGESALCPFTRASNLHEFDKFEGEATRCGIKAKEHELPEIRSKFDRKSRNPKNESDPPDREVAVPNIKVFRIIMTLL